MSKRKKTPKLGSRRSRFTLREHQQATIIGNLLADIALPAGRINIFTYVTEDRRFGRTWINFDNPDADSDLQIDNQAALIGFANDFLDGTKMTVTVQTLHTDQPAFGQHECGTLAAFETVRGWDVEGSAMRPRTASDMVGMFSAESEKSGRISYADAWEADLLRPIELGPGERLV